MSNKSYDGLKIDDKIIIVEKQNENSQGYVVTCGDQKMLTSAMKWAEVRKNGRYENNSWIYDTLPGIPHEYDNGQFTFELMDSADGSSQGGKLSFWNCKITAKDNKSYLIGINSDVLINMLKNNTFVNGKCQGNVWLGRRCGQVAAFTEAMDEFQQAKYDEATRVAMQKKTKKYNPGDEVVTITEKDVYLGEYELPFRIFTPEYSWGRYAHEFKYYITILEKPERYHLYRSSNAYSSDTSLGSDYYFCWRSLDFKTSKISRALSGNKFPVNSVWEEVKKSVQKQLEQKLRDETLSKENLAAQKEENSFKRNAEESLKRDTYDRMKFEVFKKLIDHCADVKLNGLVESPEEFWTWCKNNLEYLGLRNSELNNFEIVFKNPPNYCNPCCINHAFGY